MTRPGMVPLAALCIVLAAGVGLELRTVFKDEGAMIQSQPRVASLPQGGLQAGLPLQQPVQRQGFVDTILARPLFSPDRRPAARAIAGSAAPPPALSRVTGIVVDGSRRAVFFAAADGGKPIVLGEGAELKGYRVQSIEPTQVTVMGPNGPVVLRPTFDPAPPQAKAASPGLPGLALPNLSGIPGLGAPPAASAR